MSAGLFTGLPLISSAYSVPMTWGQGALNATVRPQQPAQTNNLFSTLATVLVLSRLLDREAPSSSATSSVRTENFPSVAVAVAEDSVDADAPAAAAAPAATTTAPAATTTAQSAPAAAPVAQGTPVAAPGQLPEDFDVPVIEVLRVIREAGTTFEKAGANGLRHGTITREQIAAYIQRVGPETEKGRIARFIQEVIPKFAATIDNDFYGGRLSEEAFVGLATGDGNNARITRREVNARPAVFFKYDGRRDAPNLNFTIDMNYQRAIGAFFGESYRTGVHPLDRPPATP